MNVQRFFLSSLVLRLCSLSPVLCPLSHVSVPCLPSAVPSLTSLFLNCLPRAFSEFFLSSSCHPFSVLFSPPCLTSIVSSLTSLYCTLSPVLYPLSHGSSLCSRPVYPVSRDLFPVSQPPFSSPNPYQLSQGLLFCGSIPLFLSFAPLFPVLCSSDSCLVRIGHKVDPITKCRQREKSEISPTLHPSSEHQEQWEQAQLNLNILYRWAFAQFIVYIVPWRNKLGGQTQVFVSACRSHASTS